MIFSIKPRSTSVAWARVPGAFRVSASRGRDTVGQAADPVGALAADFLQGLRLIGADDRVGRHRGERRLGTGDLCHHPSSAFLASSARPNSAARRENRIRSSLASRSSVIGLGDGPGPAIAVRPKGGAAVIVATNRPNRRALAAYPKRWAIESFFADAKDPRLLPRGHPPHRPEEARSPRRHPRHRLGQHRGLPPRRPSPHSAKEAWLSRQVPLPHRPRLSPTTAQGRLDRGKPFQTSRNPSESCSMDVDQARSGGRCRRLGSVLASCAGGFVPREQFSRPLRPRGRGSAGGKAWRSPEARDEGSGPRSATGAARPAKLRDRRATSMGSVPAGRA